MNDRMIPSTSIELDPTTKDPHILENFKHGAEGLIEFPSLSLSPGSVVPLTESLRMRIIWPGLRRINELADMMTDNQNDGDTGYVSNENNAKAEKIFEARRHMWQSYIGELKLRAAYTTWGQTTGTAESANYDSTGPPRPLPDRPSEECGIFYEALAWQLLGLSESLDTSLTSCFDELEATSSITKFGPATGPEPNAFADTTAVHLPVTPMNLEPHRQAVQDALMDDSHAIPGVKSYYSARKGHVTKYAENSEISRSLVSLLKGISRIGVGFSSMEWLPFRLPLSLLEELKTDTGKVLGERQLMEARVSGYLRDSSNSLRRPNTDALAILEAKRYPRSLHLSSIKGQEGAMMACWISQAGDSQIGLLRSSSSGRKRRLMISQYRHEIYIVVGEYGGGFEKYIRPSKRIKQGSNKPNGSMGTFPQADSSSADSGSTPPTPGPRYARLILSCLATSRQTGSEGLIVEVEDEYDQAI